MNPLIILLEENDVLRNALQRNKNTASEAMFALRKAMASKYEKAELIEAINEVVTILSKI